MANSDHPRTGESAAFLVRFSEGPPAFRNLYILRGEDVQEPAARSVT
jgi:hypothetical protein